MPDLPMGAVSLHDTHILLGSLLRAVPVLQRVRRSVDVVLESRRRECVEDPFAEVAGHVEDAVYALIGPVGLHRRDVVDLAVTRPDRSVVAPRIGKAARASGREFPLGFGGKLLASPCG